jgi:hypothetical protein
MPMMMAVRMMVASRLIVVARMIVVAVDVTPRMIMAMVPAILHVRDHARGALLRSRSDARAERRCRLRLLRGRTDNEQPAHGEKAENFFEIHQYSPSSAKRIVNASSCKQPQADIRRQARVMQVNMK